MKKNLNLSGTRDKLSGKIGLTGDIILGATIITIEADNHLFIENYKGIINYTDTCILIEGRKNKIMIEGKNLPHAKVFGEFSSNLHMDFLLI